MTLVVDGKRIRTDFAGGTTLSSLLRFVMDLPECRGRTIDSVELNGVPVEFSDETSLLSVPPDSEVRVCTRPVKRVLLEAALSCRDYLPRLRQGCISTAVQLQLGRQQEAFTGLQEIISGLHWYNEFLTQVVSFELRVHDEARVRLNAFRAVLSQLLPCLEERDFTLLADLLEYDLVPELEAGLGVVDLLVAELSAELGNGQ